MLPRHVQKIDILRGSKAAFRGPPCAARHSFAAFESLRASVTATEALLAGFRGQLQLDGKSPTHLS
jgi:hypothetical protein